MLVAASVLVAIACVMAAGKLEAMQNYTLNCIIHLEGIK